MSARRSQGRIHISIFGDDTVTHRTDARDNSLGNANTEKQVQVSANDLPICCPSPGQKIWDAHPRVYLPVEESGEATCPYCGTHYVLSD
jgi:uncharacterized Zn-finger protein